MNFKKLIRSLTACAILTLSLGAAVHADESYPALEVSEQGYEEIIPSYDGTLCVAKQNEKYGLINAQGEVLVDFLYDAYTLPNLQGYTIFYKDQTESLSGKDGWLDDDGIWHNADYGPLECIRNSFLYDNTGKLLYSAEKTIFASINNDMLVRTRNFTEIGFYEGTIPAYTVEYLDIHDFEHTLARYENAISSTIFSELYAAIQTVDLKEFYNDANRWYSYEMEESRIHIINMDGNEIFNKTLYELLGEDFFTPLVNTDVRIPDAALDGTVILIPVFHGYGAAEYVYLDFVSGNIERISKIEGIQAVRVQNIASMSYRNRAVAAVLDEVTNYVTPQLMNISTGKVLTKYASVSNVAASNLLVKNESGQWGYIDLWGREKNFYKDAADFINGKALVMDDENRVYMINEKFERISDYLIGATGVTYTYIMKADGLCYLVKNFGTINDRTGDENRFFLAIGDTRAKVWGKYLYNDVAPVVISDRTMLPARFVAENLGAEVGWDETNECVTIKDDKHSIELYIGSNNAKVDGKEVVLDSVPFVANDRTYCPVRFICESLEAKVEWLEDTEEIVIEWK